MSKHWKFLCISNIRLFLQIPKPGWQALYLFFFFYVNEAYARGPSSFKSTLAPLLAVLRDFLLAMTVLAKDGTVNR